MRHRMRFVSVEKADFDKSLGALCGLSEKPDTVYEGEGFADEMMVLAFVPQDLLNRFLSAFRQHKIPSVRLKAMLTETNSTWNSLALHKELLEEDEWFRNNKGPRHSQDTPSA